MNHLFPMGLGSPHFGCRLITKESPLFAKEKSFMPKPTDLFAKASVDHIASLRGSKKTTTEREVYARLESARAAVYSFGDALKHLVVGLGKVVYAIGEAPMSLAYKNLKPMATLTTASEHLTSSGKMVPLFVGALVGIVAPDATTSLYGKLSLPLTLGRFTRVFDATKAFFGSRLGKAACLVVVGAAVAVAYQRFCGTEKPVEVRCIKEVCPKPEPTVCPEPKVTVCPELNPTVLLKPEPTVCPTPEPTVCPTTVCPKPKPTVCPKPPVCKPTACPVDPEAAFKDQLLKY